MQPDYIKKILEQGNHFIIDMIAWEPSIVWKSKQESNLRQSVKVVYELWSDIQTDGQTNRDYYII